MSDSLPKCPECGSEYAYETGALLVCPIYAHEWEPVADDGQEYVAEGAPEVRDAVGKVLNDGDTVTVIKNLKVKGNSLVIKAGTKVRNIRIVDGVEDHDIDCRIDGVGAMQLKSSVVKKA